MTKCHQINDGVQCTAERKYGERLCPDCNPQPIERYMKIRTAVQPVVYSNMTLEETLRAAEHAFPTPSPLIALMMAHLRIGSDKYTTDRRQLEALKRVHSGAGALHCPSCGTQLHIEHDANGGEKEEHF